MTSPTSGGTIPAIAVAPIGVNVQDADVDEESLRDVGEQLVKAFNDVGFCFITDHGVDKSLLDRSLENINSFFSKPYDVKKGYMRKEAADFVGWVPLPNTPGFDLKSEAFETKLPDLKEMYNLNKWAGESKFVSDDVVPGFGSTASCLLTSMELLSKRIMLAFGYGLGLEDPRCLWRSSEKIESPTPMPDINASQARFVRYPRVPSGHRQDGQFWCGEHSDFGHVSILHNNGVAGLQIMTKQGEYVDVPRCDNGLILNVGDCLERLTGGCLRSVPHRVVIREGEEEDRYSVIYFLNPDYDVYLNPVCGAKDDYSEKLTAMDFLMLRIDGENLNIKKGLCKAFQQQR